jgi:hypothetical protein
MATQTQICERALKRIGIIQAGASASSVDVSDAAEALGAMIESWNAEGLSGNALPFDSRFEHAIIALLAVRISENYGAPVGTVLASDAKNGWAAIQAAYLVVPESKFERAIASTGPDWSDSYILGDTSNYAEWQADTAYEARTFATNGANLYEVVTGGTSATSGGPAGTETEITDGTVVWCWRRVVE